MKAIIALTIVVAGLLAIVAWAATGSKSTHQGYQVEVRDIAGSRALVVVPEVVTTAPLEYSLPEVVVRANLMPEVVAHGFSVREIAGLPRLGPEFVN